MAGPIEQFEVKPLVEFGTVNVPVLGEQLIAITNAHVAMTIAFALVVGFLSLATSKMAVVPGRMQAAGETLFGMVDNLTSSIIGHEGKKYFPFAFTLFTLILAMNLLGMFLTFTATSQLAVTLTLGLISFLTVVVIGFAKNGLGFFKLFWPAGAPLFLRPVVGLIELASFILRPATLGLRLFGNMLGGHVALKIFAQFVVQLGAVAIATGGLAYAFFGVAALSLGMTVAMTALEFLVAFLQAFVFTVLTCIYLNDVVNLGDGH
jgi:F-type H+-transporting ATPase subunit a